MHALNYAYDIIGSRHTKSLKRGLMQEKYYEQCIFLHSREYFFILCYKSHAHFYSIIVFKIECHQEISIKLITFDKIEGSLSLPSTLVSLAVKFLIHQNCGAKVTNPNYLRHNKKRFIHKHTWC